MFKSAYYSGSIREFSDSDDDVLLGRLAGAHHHALEETQREAWLEQIATLRIALHNISIGHVFFEFYIPRMGKRADVILVIKGILFVLEFKTGKSLASRHASDQAEDYALDLKNFHSGSHSLPIVPVVIASGAQASQSSDIKFAPDRVAAPLTMRPEDFGSFLARCASTSDLPDVEADEWSRGSYQPTPTIIEAARVLFETHSVEDITRYGAGAENLQKTSASVHEAIADARRYHRKIICLVTGVPGSGKTLAGLNIATARVDSEHDDHATFLSGNDPLVNVLRSALEKGCEEEAQYGDEEL